LSSGVEALIDYSLPVENILQGFEFRKELPFPTGGRMAMEEKGEMQGYEERDFMRNDAFPAGLEPDVETGSSPFTWRGLVIAVIAAIILSLAATLLLGG
jgi:hypothetical protein